MENMNPPWWTKEHSSTWDRVKEAMHRDWEQTKADLSKTGGRELNQMVGDTVRQAVGKEALPPADVPNPKATDWSQIEPAVRYGYGARSEFGPKHQQWDPSLEDKLRLEWTDIQSDHDWSDY